MESRGAARVRRMLDVLIALAVLVITAPLFVLIAVAIRLDSPGPIFYSQWRLGRGGRRFRLHKFRKFHEDASDARAVTLKNDPRMTRVGRWLERTKLDEFPQFLNVLVGDMAVVGPRPESIAFADCFSGSYRALLEHTPGLFGPSQVAFRNESSVYPADRDPHEFYRSVLFPTKARIDLAYFRTRTTASDLLWIFRGAWAVIWWKGLAGTPPAAAHLFQPATATPLERQFSLPGSDAGQ